MGRQNFAWKLSEKSQRCSKYDPTGHRSARFGPGVATKFTRKHYSNTFSDSFMNLSENPHWRANLLAIRRLIAAWMKASELSGSRS